MWFKNLQIYRLPTPWNIDLAKFDEQLARGTFSRCASHEAISRGWVAPRKDGALVYASNHQWLIALAVEQRLLPSSVVNDEVRERADKLTEEQGYAPGRKALRELKERNIWVVGADSVASEDLYSAELPAALAWVLGAEGEGLRRLTRETCDQLVRIPMLGQVESLNVSVASGVVLFESRRRRPTEVEPRGA